MSNHSNYTGTTANNVGYLLADLENLNWFPGGENDWDPGECQPPSTDWTCHLEADIDCGMREPEDAEYDIGDCHCQIIIYKPAGRTGDQECKAYIEFGQECDDISNLAGTSEIALSPKAYTTSSVTKAAKQALMNADLIIDSR